MIILVSKGSTVYERYNSPAKVWTKVCLLTVHRFIIETQIGPLLQDGPSAAQRTSSCRGHSGDALTLSWAPSSRVLLLPALGSTDWKRKDFSSRAKLSPPHQQNELFFLDIFPDNKTIRKSNTDFQRQELPRLISNSRNAKESNLKAHLHLHQSSFHPTPPVRAYSQNTDLLRWSQVCRGWSIIAATQNEVEPKVPGLPGLHSGFKESLGNLRETLPQNKL